MLDQATIDGISPGVRDFVIALNEAGFPTTDSGDGSNYAAGMGCALPTRHVAIFYRDPDKLIEETRRLVAFLAEYKLDWPAFQVEAVWNPAQHGPMILINETSEASLAELERDYGSRPRGMW